MPKSDHASRDHSAAGSARFDQPVTVHFGSEVAPVRRTLGMLTRRVHQISFAMLADSVAEADVTPMQYGAMACLNRTDGEPGLDQNGLAARLGIDRNNMSLMVDDLAAKGLVERSINGADRRSRLLQLTAKGERLFAKIHPKNIAAQAHVLEPLTPHERERLLDLLLRIIAANGMHARPGAGRRKRGSRPQHQKNKNHATTSRNA